MQEVYPKGHPSVGIVLAELGKLLNAESGNTDDSGSGKSLQKKEDIVIQLPVDVTGRMGVARETLVKALAELRIGFGRSGGLVGKELEYLVEGISREMTANRL